MVQRVLKGINGVVRMTNLTPEIYDETVVVPNGGYAALTNLTLPASETYSADELQVYLNGQLLEVGIDYNYVGTAPRTQIQIQYALQAGERLRYRIQT